MIEAAATTPMARRRPASQTDDPERIALSEECPVRALCAKLSGAGWSIRHKDVPRTSRGGAIGLHESLRYRSLTLSLPLITDHRLLTTNHRFLQLVRPLSLIPVADAVAAPVPAPASAPAADPDAVAVAAVPI